MPTLVPPKALSSPLALLLSLPRVLLASLTPLHALTLSAPSPVACITLVGLPSLVRNMTALCSLTCVVVEVAIVSSWAFMTVIGIDKSASSGALALALLSRHTLNRLLTHSHSHSVFTNVLIGVPLRAFNLAAYLVGLSPWFGCLCSRSCSRSFTRTCAVDSPLGPPLRFIPSRQAVLYVRP